MTRFKFELPRQSAPAEHHPAWRCGLVCLLLTCFSGCSLFVMAGKTILGDPQVQSPLKAATGIDLVKSEEAVLILCSAPHGIQANLPSLQIDIVDRVSRDLQTHKVNVLPADDVASWYDDHGEWGDFSELANHFDATYVIHIDLGSFAYRLPESDNLLKGRSDGQVRVYKVSDNEQIPIQEVFDHSFKVEFPTSYPVPRENRSDEMFVEGFMDRVALHIAQMLYDHSMSLTVH